MNQKSTRIIITTCIRSGKIVSSHVILMELQCELQFQVFSVVHSLFSGVHSLFSGVHSLFSGVHSLFSVVHSLFSVVCVALCFVLYLFFSLCIFKLFLFKNKMLLCCCRCCCFLNQNQHRY